MESEAKQVESCQQLLHYYFLQEHKSSYPFINSLEGLRCIACRIIWPQSWRDGIYVSVASAQNFLDFFPQVEIMC